MDGGIKLENARTAAEAECEVFVMGSAVFNSSNPSDYLTKTRNELKNI